LIVQVLLAEKVEQSNFLENNSFFKENPGRKNVKNEANWIREYYLSCDAPIEPANVAWMTHVGINAICDEFVIVSLLKLNLED
jgi:hypothetical protein